jgi:hypothetical protein
MKPYGPSRLGRHVNPPPGFDPSTLAGLWQAAAREIANYTAVIVLEAGRTASGTFVEVNGVRGVLTAHHVAREVVKPNSRLHLAVASFAHKLQVSSAFFEQEVVGDSTGNPKPGSGPDLSFLRILDVGLIGTIAGQKSFLVLAAKDFSFFRPYPKRRMKWFVAGTPYEFAQSLTPIGTPPTPLTKVSNFVGDAFYRSITRRDAFDYIKVSVPAGEPTFPTGYKGVSGGGIWMVPLSIGDEHDPATIRYEAPFLAGVAFYESPIRRKARVITGHGPDSIYSCVRRLHTPHMP